MSILSRTEITSEGVRIRLLGVPKTILFKDIESVQKVSRWKAVILSINPAKPLVNVGTMSFEGGVLVETKYFRWTACPKDRNEFVDLVSSHLTISN